MLGWTIIFALIAFLAGFMVILTGPAAASSSMKLATLLFGALFLACLFTRVVRGRA